MWFLTHTLNNFLLRGRLKLTEQPKGKGVNNFVTRVLLSLAMEEGESKIVQNCLLSYMEDPR